MERTEGTDGLRRLKSLHGPGPVTTRVPHPDVTSFSEQWVRGVVSSEDKNPSNSFVRTDTSLRVGRTTSTTQTPGSTNVLNRSLQSWVPDTLRTLQYQGYDRLPSVTRVLFNSNPSVRTTLFPFGVYGRSNDRSVKDCWDE